MTKSKTKRKVVGKVGRAVNSQAVAPGLLKALGLNNQRVCELNIRLAVDVAVEVHCMIQPTPKQMAAFTAEVRRLRDEEGLRLGMTECSMLESTRHEYRLVPESQATTTPARGRALKRGES